MSDESRRLDDYLDHILNAIGKIERYTPTWIGQRSSRMNWSRTA